MATLKADHRAPTTRLERKSPSAFTAAMVPKDIRRDMPRFAEPHFSVNSRLLIPYRRIADEIGCTPAQLALAWVLAQGDDIIPIPGTKRVKYLEENVKAAEIRLTPHQLTRLDEIAPRGAAAGTRYPDMSFVNR